MYRNFRLKSNKGTFYLSSQEPQAGYQEVKHNFGVSYHKQFNEVTGTLVGAEINTPTAFTAPPRLKIFLEEGDDTNVIETPIFDDKDRVEPWCREFIKFLPSLNLGDELTFALNRKKKDDKGYLYKNLYINRGTEKVPWAFDKDEIPALDKKKNRAGEEKLDSTKRDDWYYDILKREVDRLALQRDTEPAGQDNGFDDLPF